MPTDPFEPKYHEDVLPAVRALLSQEPWCTELDARGLALVLQFRGYLEIPPINTGVEAALQALRLEDEVVA